MLPSPDVSLANNPFASPGRMFCTRLPGLALSFIDTAGGHAGYTLFPADSSVLTVGYKLNLLAPAEGEFFVAEGRVAKPGRTLCIVQGEVYAQSGERRTLCAPMQQTLIVLRGRPDDATRRN